ncbi:MAG: GGDEF domain-containing phosphodiesterase, partial [Austwickia sp.]|nr:GGDEF domain-containing phosphodiesterase [Austwickia sp.]
LPLVAFPVTAETDRLDRVIARLTGSISRPMRVGGQLLQVNVSVGAARGDAGDQIDAVIKQAEAAMRMAKSTSTTHGPPRWADERQRVRALLDEKEIRVEYQPIVAIDTRLPVGFEALLRVTDKELGVISPEVLVDSASRVRLLDELTLLVSEQALELMQSLSTLTSRRLSLSLNLEFEQLRSDNVTLSWLVDEFTEATIDLILEITERHTMRWTAAHANVARGLARHGITLAVDDFGTGYATYRFLEAWDWAEVKVDRDLVRARNDHGRLLLRHIAALLGELNVHTVAEGIESAELLDYVAGLGFTHAQGYHLGRPMTAVDLLERADAGWLDRPVC